jgi:transglycosylase-like protein with SLT domain
VRRRRRWWLSAWTLGPLLVGGLVLAIMLVALAATVTTITRAASGCDAGAGPGVDVADIPATLMPIYEQAAAGYQLGGDGWAYLASINYAETDFGHNLATSSTGAIGWMQFEPGTWSQYAVSADPSKPGAAADPYDPWDAIFTAARYLLASGAPGNWPGAIYVYNHAGWYVAAVTDRAERYLTAAGGAVLVALPADCSQPSTAGGYANPFAHAPGLTAERIDMGVDYAGSGEIDAVGNARVVFAATGIGGNWVCSTPENGGVVYQLTDGRYQGDYVYVTEDVIPTVHPGDTVAAGQQVATFTSPHGCLEIGFADGPSPAPKAAALGQQAQTGDAGENRTYCGQQMSDLLAATGAPAGLAEGRPVSGERCE